MRISIAMATYNGERFIHEQLDSFARQSRLPDELVVSDDGSSDRTLDIVESFARSAPFSVRIYQNKINLGYALNFDRAIQECTGDMIFLSDQDDYWFPEKLARIEKEFAAYPQAMLIMSDAELVHGDGTPTGLTKLNQTLALGLDDAAFTTGCCMAFRKSFVALALPVPSSQFVHDTWLNKVGLTIQVKRIVPLVLQNYRRHDNNTSAWIASRTSKLSRFDLVKEYKGKDPRPACITRLDQLKVLEQRLKERALGVLKPLGMDDRLYPAYARLAAERQAVEDRLRALQHPRRARLVSALSLLVRGQYRYFSGWKSFVKDLIRT